MLSSEPLVGLGVRAFILCRKLYDNNKSHLRSARTTNQSQQTHVSVEQPWRGVRQYFKAFPTMLRDRRTLGTGKDRCKPTRDCDRGPLEVTPSPRLSCTFLPNEHDLDQVATDSHAFGEQSSEVLQHCWHAVSHNRFWGLIPRVVVDEQMLRFLQL